MGRAVFFSAKVTKKLSNQQKKIIHTVQNEYNKKFKWTCECFWMEDLQYQKIGGLGRSFEGFVKVGGNELNAAHVVSAISKISKKIPNLKFSLYDEGKYLLLPLEVSKGRARVDFESIFMNEIDSEWKMAMSLGITPSSNRWRPISFFHRKVNPKDFENYPEINSTYEMADYYGKNWKKKVDAEIAKETKRRNSETKSTIRMAA